MEKSRQKTGMSLTYKVNGDMCSFKTVDDLLNHLKMKAEILKEPLTLEPISKEGQDYDHMQEILDLTYQAIPCIKGLQAMAGHIQERGNFIEYDTSDIIQLGIRCTELLKELMDIAEASENVYESDWKIQNLKAESRKEGCQAHTPPQA